MLMEKPLTGEHKDWSVDDELRTLLKEKGLLNNLFGTSDLEYYNALLEADAAIDSSLGNITIADRLLRATDKRIADLQTIEHMSEAELRELRVLLRLKDKYREDFNESVAERDGEQS